LDCGNRSLFATLLKQPFSLSIAIHASSLAVIKVRLGLGPVGELATNSQHCTNKQRRAVSAISSIEILDKVILRDAREDWILPTEVQEQELLDNGIT
jgi:hypothetical protein